MKSLLITAAIIGTVAAALIYLTDDRSFLGTTDEADDVTDAAEDAYTTMNKHLGHVERKTENALNKTFG
jgi:hypothetical protein